MKTVWGVSTDKEVAELLGGSRGFVSVLKNRGTIPYAECVTMAIETNTSLDWLILGRGPKEVEGIAAVAPIPAHLVELPFLDVEDVDIRRDQENWYVPRDWLGLQGLAADGTVAVRVVGDAMEHTLSEGQVVLLDLEQKSADGVYLVRFGAGAAYFRRIQHMADGSVRLSCDNPVYAAEVVPAADRDRLQIIGYCHSVVRTVR